MGANATLAIFTNLGEMPSIPGAVLYLTSLIARETSLSVNSCHVKLCIIDLKKILSSEMLDGLLFDKFEPTLAKYSHIRFKNSSLSVSHDCPFISKEVGSLLRELFLPSIICLSISQVFLGLDRFSVNKLL